MEIYFIRHAQSENNYLWDTTGTGENRFEDPDITEIGMEQVEFLCKFLKEKNNHELYSPKDYHNRKGFNFSHIYSSPFLRAAKTAWGVAQSMDMPIEFWVDLHEGGGVWLAKAEEAEPEGLPGKPRYFFEKNFPGAILPDDLTAAGWWNKPFEKPEERGIRAERVIQKLMSNHSQEDTIALFSHANFFNHFIAKITGRDRVDGVWFNMNNTGIARFDIELIDNRIDIVYVNKVDFLPAHLIT